jgi:hypothetical protein
MEETYSTQQLLALRKATRSISELLRGQMKDYVSTLAPLFLPRNVLGNYAERGAAYQASHTGEKAFSELRELYQKIGQSKLYQLPSELKTPLEVISTQLEMTPVEYTHSAVSDGQSKSIVVTSPLKWALTYRGFGVSRFREVLANRDRTTDDVQQFVLHYLMMNSVVTKQPGLANILEQLRFPVSVECLAEFGDVPLTYISSSISTVRPPDRVLLESSEVSGMNAFEELVQLEDIPRLRDHLKEQLIEIAGPDSA